MPEWWEKPGSNATVPGNPVTRHAPDDGQYHVPDSEQAAKIGGLVRNWAVVPKARKDGTTRAFDPTVAGPVHVDPHVSDGGVVFDPNAVRADVLEQAIEASEYPEEVFYALGVSPKMYENGRQLRVVPGSAEASEAPRTNTRLPPGSYIAPQSHRDGRQIAAGDASLAPGEPMNPQPPLHNLPPLIGRSAPPPLAAAPVLQTNGHHEAPQAITPQAIAPPPMPQWGPAPGYPYPYPPAPDPTLQTLISAVAAMQGQIGALVQAQQMQQTQQIQQAVPPTTGLSPNPLPKGRPTPLATLPAERVGRKTQLKAVEGNGERQDAPDEMQSRPIRSRRRRRDDSADQEIEQDDNERPARRQTTREYDESLREVDGVIVGFESLGLTWLVGPIAQKPKRQVVFDIPGAGRSMARFHDVIESPRCLALVYDTRYEDGHQYEPPDLLDASITVHVKIDNKKEKTYEVSSMGFTVTIGVLDIIMLVRHEKSDLEEE